MEIKEDDRSLVNAIEDARAVVEKVTEAANNFCAEDEDHDDDNCDDNVDAGNFQIEPKYQNIRKIPTFVGNVFGYN